ncbi:MAG: hypothetical protein ACFFBP_02915 [Promethearchaeota archaeon]
MFCNKCGTKLIESNQELCQNCGAITKKPSTISQSDSQLKIMNTQSSPQVPKHISGDQQKTSISRKIGIHSKRSLAFGITSLGLNLVGGIMGMNSLYFSTYFPFFIQLIIKALFIVAALVFGILARSNGNKAEVFEPHNEMQKAGKVMGLLGIIFSALGIGNMVLFDVLRLDYTIFRSIV